eukprot:Lankesteria_metandrocarpae@DN2651_c0_g1_i1.p1
MSDVSHWSMSQQCGVSQQDGNANGSNDSASACALHHRGAPVFHPPYTTSNSHDSTGTLDTSLLTGSRRTGMHEDRYPSGTSSSRHVGPSGSATDTGGRINTGTGTGVPTLDGNESRQLRSFANGTGRRALGGGDNIHGVGGMYVGGRGGGSAALLMQTQNSGASHNGNQSEAVGLNTGGHYSHHHQHHPNSGGVSSMDSFLHNQRSRVDWLDLCAATPHTAMHTGGTANTQGGAHHYHNSHHISGTGNNNHNSTGNIIPHSNTGRHPFGTGVMRGGVLSNTVGLQGLTGVISDLRGLSGLDSTGTMNSSHISNVTGDVNSMMDSGMNSDRGDTGTHMHNSHMGGAATGGVPVVSDESGGVLLPNGVSSEVDSHPKSASGSSLASNSISIFSWNVLADIYSTSGAFGYCNPYVLAWPYRRERIIAEVTKSNADVVCLQEVQVEHFEEFFLPVMRSSGYHGLFKQKTKEIFTSGSGKKRGGKFTIDGCATFFKTKKFRLVDYYTIEFSHLMREHSIRTLPAHIRDKPSVLKRLVKDNVALVLTLEDIEGPTLNSAAQHYHNPGGDKNNIQFSTGNTNGHFYHGNTNIMGHTDSVTGGMDNGTALSGRGDMSGQFIPLRRELIVGNTHIVASPSVGEVKLWQAQILMLALQEYVLSMTRRLPSGGYISPGVVLAGDFNSTPASAVAQLITTGRVERTHMDLTKDRLNLLSELPLAHSIPLRSAYGMSNALKSGVHPKDVKDWVPFEPVFTNYTETFVGCLDYIFYAETELRLTATTELLTAQQLLEEAEDRQLPTSALPSPIRPSDHLPLMVEFEWVQ